MNFIPTFKVGSTVSNKDIVKEFKCGNMGGMRRSKKTNTLVIISDETKDLYKDKWVNNILHYTGMQKSGDQSLDYMQNKTLAESINTDIEVHLFEVTEPAKYVYKGVFELCEEPYSDTQIGDDGKPRKVVIFPLCIINKEVADVNLNFCERLKLFIKNLFS